MKKIYIESLGCAKNQVDSEVLATLAEDAGYTLTSRPDEADVITVNTCGFIEDAKKEALDTFFSFRNGYPDKKIILAGCLAQRYFDEIELPEPAGRASRGTGSASGATTARSFAPTSPTERSI